VIRLLLAVSLLAAAPAWAQTIKIGLVTALSGQSARAGEAITRGLSVAIDEINANGGVLGRKL
jgi:branched-chain amino acid transport system substrate-binding protein